MNKDEFIKQATQGGYTSLNVVKGYAYTQYDLKVYRGAWERLGTDCSVRHVKLYVECPVCRKEHVVRRYDEF